MKLSIIHKGLALLVLPLALQIACIVQLYVLVSEAADLAAREARLARVVRLKDEYIQAFTLSWQNFLGGQNADPKLLNKLRLKVEDSLGQLKGLVKDDPQMSLGVENLERTARKQFKLMAKTGALSTGNSMLVKLQTLLAMKDELNDVSEGMRPSIEKLEVYRTKLEEAGRQAEVARSQIKTAVLIGIAVEIVLTIGIIAVFLQDIRKRLSILVDNARAIPAGRVLTKSVSGNDELAYLDKVLHEASDDLHKAAEYRKSLMQMVAHDLRSPLGTAKLEADNIVNLAEKSESPLKENGKRIKKIVNQLIFFVEDLLTIDKLEAGKLELRYEAVDIRKVVDDAIGGISAAAKDKSIELVNQADALTVAADPQRIMQVLNNLISNAIKFSPTGKSITVSTTRGQDEIRVAVRDDGPGVPREQQASLFDKYFQSNAHNPSGGFGLGLAICKLIVKQHEGNIGVDSQPGQGSTFWFTLPLDDDDPDV